MKSKLYCSTILQGKAINAANLYLEKKAFNNSRFNLPYLLIMISATASIFLLFFVR